MRILTAGMPKPGGHYSPCVEHAGVLYVSGQLPIDPDTGTIAADIEAQTRQTLANLERILVAAGSRRDRVLQVRVYVADIAQWGAVNAVYAEFFSEHRPARAIVPTGALHFGALLEIEATAVVEDG
jgi:reactive intermediate/imine deaminase